MQKKIILFTSILVCLLVSAGFRFYGLGEAAIQPDERIWVVRSAKVLTMLREDPRRLTTHLGHPGVPPGLLMAGAQLLNEKAQKRWGITAEDPRHLSRLEVSRMAIASVSSLIAPLILIAGMSLFGLWPALLAAMLVAMDPRLLGYSRMAHLDAILTLLTAASVLLYAAGVTRGKPWLKLTAGAFWGLAIATKPTAGVLVVCFFIYRILRVLLLRSGKRTGEKGLLGWSDGGAVLVGHLVFALIYTRLWDHRGDYRVRLNVQVRAAKWFWQTGRYLQQHIFLVAIIAAVTVICMASLWYSRRRRMPGLVKFGASCTAIFGPVVLALAAFPQVFENFARYWKWASGLSGESHMSFGHLKPPTTHGYADLAFSELPLICLAGLALAAVFIFPRIIRRKAGEYEFLVLFMLTAAFCWLAVLNISSKQTWRYALPIVPLLYLAAAAGWIELLSRLKMRLQGRPGAAAYAGCLAALMGVQFHQTASWYPHYDIFFNRISGGLPGALKRGQGFPFVGQREAVEWLLAKAEKRKRPLYTTVFVGANDLDSAVYRWLGPAGKEKLKFGFFSREGSDYVLHFVSHENMAPSSGWSDVLNSSPEFVYSFHGTPLLKIFKMPLRDYGEEKSIKASQAFRHTGRVEFDEAGSGVLFSAARPERDVEGTLLFTEGLRMPKGRYRVGIGVKLLQPAKPGTPAVRLALGPECIREISADELSPFVKEFELLCSFDRAGRHAPIVWWYGSAAVAVSGVAVKAAGPD